MGAGGQQPDGLAGSRRCGGRTNDVRVRAFGQWGLSSRRTVMEEGVQLYDYDECVGRSIRAYASDPSNEIWGDEGLIEAGCQVDL